MSSRAHLVKRFVITGGVFVIAFGALGWYQLIYKPDQKEAALASRTKPAITVSAAKAKAETWQPRLTSVGTLRAINGVAIAPEVDGIVTKINFDSGQDVTAGTVLTELDVTVEEADLKNTEAALKDAELTLGRGQTLYKKRDYPKARLDADQAQRDQAAAEVERIKALIEQKHIRAPFDGRIGIRQADLGEYLSAGTTIVSLEALDPIFVDFALPEQELSKLSVGQTVQVKVDAYTDQTFSGEIAAIDARVNQSTRNVLVRGTLDNPENRLLPGMFANVRVVLREKKQVVTVPETAVTYGLYGDTVYLVTPASATSGGQDKGTSGKSGDANASDTKASADKTGGSGGSLVATRQTVKVGERRGDSVAILEGVKVGDEVVTAGQIKLQNHAPVKIDNSVALTAPSVRPNQ